MKENRRKYSGYITSRIPESARIREKELPRQMHTIEKPNCFGIDQEISQTSGEAFTTKRESKFEREKYQVQELEKLIQKIDECNDELRNRRRRIAELEAENGQMAIFKNECESTRKELEKINIINKKLREEIEGLKLANAEISKVKTEEVERHRAAALEINALLHKEKESHNLERASLTQEIKEMQEKLNNLSGNFDAKMEEFKLIQEEREEGDRRMQQQIQTQRFQLEKHERLKQYNEDQIHTLQVTSDNLAKQLESYRQDNSVLTASILNEKETLAKVESQFFDLKERNGKLEQLHQELLEIHDIKIEELEKFKNLAQRQDQTIKLLKSNMAEDKDALNKQEDTVKMLKMQLEILLEDNDKMKRSLEGEIQHSRELENLVQSLSVQKSELEKQQISLSAELQRLKTEISSFSALKKRISEAQLKEVRNLSRAVGAIYPESN